MNIKGLILLLCLALLLCATALAAPPEPDPDSVDAGAPAPIFLTLFIHDQLDPREVADLGPDYLEWFLKELTQVTGRRVNVIRVVNTPGMTDFGYRQGDDAQTMREWQNRVLDYIEARNLPLSTKYHKYLLITRHNVTPEVMGVAYSNRGIAIASIRAYNTIGHEIGHMLGATHENAETRLLSFPPCRTLMYPEHSALFANCFVFSDKNRQAIHEYLNGNAAP
ncbi:hypothetical protein PS3A_27430 [Pseudomonas sp. 3A(2025)]